MWLAGTVRAVQVFADGICSGDEAEFAVLAQLGIRGVGRIGCQNQDRTGLVGWSHEGDDLRSGACEIDISDVELVPQLRIVMEDAIDFGALGTVVAGFDAIDEVVAEQEKSIEFHGMQYRGQIVGAQGGNREQDRSLPLVVVFLQLAGDRN